MSVNHVLGHRQRLKKKILKSLGSGMEDYELLEYVLFNVFARKDVKLLSKEILNNRKSIVRLFNSSVEELSDIKGVGDATIASVICIREIIRRIFLSKVDNSAPIVSNWQSLLDYLYISCGDLEFEVLKVFYLDDNKAIIQEDVFNSGSSGNVHLCEKSILKKALNISASSIVLSHNHPSGIVGPSKEDIAVTNKLKSACNALGVVLLDHIIVSSRNHYSFRENGII